MHMNTVTDPVCNMTIDPARAVGTSTYDGVTYHFCSRGCETKFDSAPALFAGNTTMAPAASCCTTAGHSCC
jgi:P-type Cu+ transporter